MRRHGSLFPWIWVIIGIFVAFHYRYNSIANVSRALSFIAAILLWPLVLLGVNLNIKI